MNIIGLDIGEKKIGIAISTSGMIASELTTIENNDRAIPFLIDLVRQKKIEKIVVGLPLLRSGDESLEAKKVRGFIVELTEKHPISVEYEDEMLTSKEAERILQKQNLTLVQIRARTDQLSAKIILEQYLNSTNKS